MTNNEIIINQAIAHGIYTKAEAQAIVAAKGCLPIHTFAEWKKAGYSVKRGEHAAITCDLWKYTERPGKAAKAARAEAAKSGQNGPDADAPDPHYYMAKAHLFTLDQVKPAGQDDAPKPKTPEEIAAYNKKLADERSRPPQLPPRHSPPQNVSKFPCFNPRSPQGRRHPPPLVQAQPPHMGRALMGTRSPTHNTKQEAAHYDHLHAFPSV